MIFYLYIKRFIEVLLMIKKVCVLTIILSISIFHTSVIYPIINSYISYNIYITLLFSYLILLQIDNYNLFIDLKSKEIIQINNNVNDINVDNLNLIIKQLSNISRKQEEFIYKKYIKYKNIDNRMTRSCNDLNNI